MPTSINDVDANDIDADGILADSGNNADASLEAQAAFERGEWELLDQLPPRRRARVLRQGLDHLFSTCDYFKGNFFRLLANDRCFDRHGTLDPEMLEDTCPLDNGRHEDPPNTLFSIGDLNRLPLEILQGILVDGIDFASLTSLRRVSRGMRSTIDSLPKYKAIVTHAPASIRAALSLETGIYWSCSHLYHELCSNACVFCGHFGANLNVLICKRVCIDCFTTDVQCLPVGREYAKATWSLKESDLKNSDTRIPTARTLPWYYVTRLFSKGHASRKRIELLEHTAVGAIAINKYGSLDVILQIRAAKIQTFAAKLTAWTAMPVEQRSTRRPNLPPFTQWTDRGRNAPERYMCIVPFPWLDRSQNAVEWGVACNGCKIAMGEEFTLEGYNNQAILYSENAFVEHFIGCERAQALYKWRYQDRICGGEKLLDKMTQTCDIVPNQFFIREPERDPLWIGKTSPEYKAEARRVLRDQVREKLRAPKRRRNAAA